MSLACFKVLRDLPNFVQYLDSKVSQFHKDMKEYYNLKFSGGNRFDKFIEKKTEYDLDVCMELAKAYQEYNGIHIHEAARFFYITLKLAFPLHKESYENRTPNVKIREQHPFVWVEKELLICLVAKNDYNTNAKLGEIFAGDIMDISTGTRDYEAGYNKNPAKIARGNVTEQSTWRNICFMTSWRLIELRPIDAVSLRPKNYPDYNDGSDFWQKNIKHLQKHKKVD
jgi:hypothetical protein